MASRIDPRGVRWPWALAGFAVVATVARIGQLPAPLAGDAAQFLYVGDTVAHGGMPYADAAYSKGPLTALLFAGIDPIVGTSPAAVRLTLVPFAALAALALAAYVARYAGRRTGALAGLMFAAYSAISVLEGAEAKTEEYGVAPGLGALWLATRRTPPADAGAGVLATCALLISPALVVVLPAVLYEVLRGGERWRRLGALAAGAAVPALAACAWLAVGGALGDMLTQVGGQVGDSFRGRPAASEPPLRFVALWALAAVPCAAAMRDRRLRPPAIAMALLMVAVLLRVELPAYGFAYQYYPAVPAICGALALGVAAVWPSRTAARAAIVLALAVPLWVLAVQPQIDLLGKGRQERNRYGATAYPVAAFVRAHTAPRDRIVVLGGRAEVYWRARRRAPDRFFDSFGTAGSSSYPAERVRDLTRTPPAAIAVVRPDRLGQDWLLRRLATTRGYRLAYSRDRSFVWLRQSSSSGSPGSS